MKVHVAWLLTVMNLAILLGVASVSAKVPATSGNAIPLAAALGTGFTYQGQLNQANNLVDGPCDFRFSLWDALSGGIQVGTSKTLTSVAVTKGLFTVQLDFGAAAFNGDARWMLVEVRCPAGSGSFTALTPRQALTPAPYALRATSAGSVPWNGITGVPLGFADGIDDGTSYTAGTGIVLNNGQISVAVPLSLEGAVQANVLAVTNTGSGRAGYFLNNSTNSAAFRGENSGNNGIGIFGAANGSQSLAILGTSPDGFGIQGETNSAPDNGAGVIGLHGPNGNYTYYVAGVAGSSIDTNGIGVSGYSNNGTTSVGVRGVSSNGFAGYFNGKTHVQGTFTASDKQFKIDHPLDPTNKYLAHASVESSDMKNIYDGVVALDKNGAATVTLPDWFQALNQEFRYQLTAIGAPGPNLYIAKEIDGNQFSIAGGTAGMKVSWQVTGIRHDRWAEEHRMQVESDKPAQERGKYLYPQGYGQPASKSEGPVNAEKSTQSRSRSGSEIGAP